MTKEEFVQMVVNQATISPEFVADAHRRLEEMPDTEVEGALMILAADKEIAPKTNVADFMVAIGGGVKEGEEQANKLFDRLCRIKKIGPYAE